MTPAESTSFTQTTYERTVVVQARGELDAGSSGSFRAALQRAVDADLPVVVIDLEHVSFLDSAGLGVVFGAHRRLPVSQRMLMANVPDRISRILRLSGVSAVVDVHNAGEPQPWLDAVSTERDAVSTERTAPTEATPTQS